METWILFTVICAICKGFFESVKKKALEKSSIYEVLAWFCLIAFIISIFINKNVFEIEMMNIFVIFIKALFVVAAWLLNLHVLEKMQISLYGVISLSTIIFSLILSILFLGEKITINIIIGAIIVILGLVLANMDITKHKDKTASMKLVVILLISCLFNSAASTMDKIILKDITNNQLQFWFLLFMTIINWIILLVKKEKVGLKTVKKNYWIPLTAVFLVVGDKFLFMANEIPESKASIIMIIRQLSAVQIIILGRILFKEKEIVKRLLCCILVILGIVITVI